MPRYKEPENIKPALPHLACSYFATNSSVPGCTGKPRCFNISPNSGFSASAIMALRQRLLRDITELQGKPYPNISIFPSDNIKDACLVLRPNGGRPLHLSVHFGVEYPLQAPTVSIQS